MNESLLKETLCKAVRHLTTNGSRAADPAVVVFSLLDVGFCLLVVGCWFFGFVCWLLVFGFCYGCWFLVVGFWLLVFFVFCLLVVGFWFLLLVVVVGWGALISQALSRI
jgi:hypothetical protein